MMETLLSQLENEFRTILAVLDNDVEVRCRGEKCDTAPIGIPKGMTVFGVRPTSKLLTLDIFWQQISVQQESLNDMLKTKVPLIFDDIKIYHHFPDSDIINNETETKISVKEEATVIHPILVYVEAVKGTTNRMIASKSLILTDNENRRFANVEPIAFDTLPSLFTFNEITEDNCWKINGNPLLPNELRLFSGWNGITQAEQPFAWQSEYLPDSTNLRQGDITSAIKQTFFDVCAVTFNPYYQFKKGRFERVIRFEVTVKKLGYNTDLLLSAIENFLEEIFQIEKIEINAAGLSRDYFQPGSNFY
ncbi:hypothetical protein FACS18942_09580 [Planctomycetales bacterium]|nr:hypothetical protein FACS18942_09580 [Planctomycetales bacterium]